MDLEHGLEMLGLSKNETEVYVRLVKGGASSAVKISQLTGINRRSVYDSLESLISKGLVNYTVEEKKKLFQPSDLKSLSAMIDEKRYVVNSLQPQLERFLSKRETEPKIEVFSGKGSMRGVFERLLDSKKTIFLYGGAMPAKEFLKYYYPQWTNKRKKMSVKMKGIFIDLPEVKNYVKGLPLISYKFIPKEFLSPAFWWLQGDKIFLVFFQENPTVVAIESKEMAKTYYNSFNILWKKL
jgi:sugar-specific transcriptional regulator TrmB